MNSFKLIDEEIAKHKKSIEIAQGLYAHMAKIDAALAPLAPFVSPRLMILNEKILVRVEVQRIKDIEPFIASLELSLGIEFDKTHDEANYGWREFRCEKAPWIRVDAELKSDGPDCRRVIVGYESVPKYEIKCGEEANQPDAPKPNQTPETDYPF